MVTHRWWGILVGLALIGVAGTVAADEPTYMDGAMHKLGRGLTNIATSPAELLRTPTLVSQRDGYLAGMSVGVLQGLWHGVQRVVVGVYEVATFYAAIPKGFRPVLSPEFVWSHGAWSE